MNEFIIQVMRCVKEPQQTIWHFVILINRLLSLGHMHEMHTDPKSEANLVRDGPLEK